MIKKIKGVYFSLVPFYILFVLAFLLFAYDLTLVYFYSKELRHLANFVAEASLKGLIQVKNAPNSTNKEQTLQQLISAAVAGQRFFFLRNVNGASQNLNISVSLDNQTASNNANDIEVVIGAYTEPNHRRPLLTRIANSNLICQDSKGCWEPILDGQNFSLANAVKVTVNRSKRLEPFTFIWRLLNNSLGLEERAFSVTRPRVIFNLLDLSPSTFEGQGGLSRRGRWRNLAFFELRSETGSSSVKSWQDCKPVIKGGGTYYEYSHESGQPCTFRGVGELIWNAPKHSQPVADYNPAFEITRTDLKFYRQSDDPSNPDHYVWIIWDTRLGESSFANKFVTDNFVDRYLTINKINEARKELYFNPSFEQQRHRQTPRLFSANSDNSLFDTGHLDEMRSAIDWEYFDHQYLEPVRGHFNLSRIYSLQRFIWNANQDYTNWWFRDSSLGGHFNLLGLEVHENDVSTIRNNLLWPIFFMGVTRPNLIGVPYHTDHLKLRNRSGESGPFVLNSPDGAIYREHALARLGADSVCCMLNEPPNNPDNWEIVCAKVLKGKVAKLTTNDNNEQQVQDKTDFYFCPLDQESGSLINWVPTNNWENLITRNLRGDRVTPLCSSNPSNGHCLCGSEIIQVGQAHWIKGCGEFNSNVVYWLNDFSFDSNSGSIKMWFSFSYYPSDWIDVSNNRLLKIPLLYNDNDGGRLVTDVNLKSGFQGRVKLIPYYTRQPYTRRSSSSDDWAHHRDFFSGLRQYLAAKQCVFSTTSNSGSTTYLKKGCYLARAHYFNFFNLRVNNNNNSNIIEASPNPQYLSRALNFLRYMSDYEPVNVAGLKKLKLNPNNNYLPEEESTSYSFHLLVENPEFLKKRKFYDENLVREGLIQQGGDYCPRVCNVNSITSPSACPYQLGFHPIVANKLRVPNNADNTSNPCYVYRDSSRGWGWGDPFKENQIPKDALLFKWGGPSYTDSDRVLLHAFWPDFYFFNDYIGPQPFSDLVQGVAWTYKLLAEDFKISGDQFGILPFTSELGFSSSFIPLQEINVPVEQIRNGNCSGLGQPGEKTCNLLASIWPNNIGPNNIWPNNFDNIEKVKKRYQLGLFPASEINKQETNLIWALAVAANYLRDISATHRVYLPVFSDFLALGSCNFGEIRNSRLSWGNIQNCIRNPSNRQTAVASASDFQNMFFDMLNALTGQIYRQGQQLHQGLLRFLAENNIVPIFFVLNGTAGGIPLTKIGGTCAYERKVLIQNGKPTAFNREVDRIFHRDIGKILETGKRSGHYGNLYIYTLGDLEPILREIGGDFVQLLPRCKVRHNSALSAHDRLLRYCSSAHRRVSPSYPTHYSLNNENFGICGHLLYYPTNWGPHGWAGAASVNSDAHRFGSCINFETARAGFGSFWGFSFLNFGLDFGVTPEAWRIDIYNDGTSTYTYTLNPFLFVGRHYNYFLHFMPHIDISVAGGLRCHPERSIFDQIREVFESLLRSPDVLIFSDVSEVSQGLSQALPANPIGIW